ncbi:unnamed protein product, partial [Vitis vinifera]
MLKLQRINMPKISVIVCIIQISLFIFLFKKIVEYCKDSSCIKIKRIM